MSSSCGKCESAIDRRKTPAISCSGFCGRQYHTACVAIPSDVLKHIKTPGLYWYCENCNNVKSEYENLIKTNVEAKLKDVLQNIEKLFEITKNEILKIADDKLSKIISPVKQDESPPLFSQVIDKKSVVIIKPKNSEQRNAETKSDIMNSINPVDLNIQVSKVKNLSNGGILIGCQDSSGADKFKQLAKQKLSSRYEIKEAKKGNFRVKIVGMIEEYSEDQIVNFIRHQNALFSENSSCRIIKIWSTKKNSRIYQAVAEVDAETYCKILNQGHLFINYDVCTVYDAIKLNICFKCSGLNHYEKNCSCNKIVCPKCSFEHSVKDCPIDAVPKCINCVNAKISDDNHFVWDSEKCMIYKKKLAHYKETLFCNK